MIDIEPKEEFLIIALVLLVPVVFWPGLFVVFSLAKLAILWGLLGGFLVYRALNRQGIPLPRSRSLLDLAPLVFLLLSAAATIGAYSRPTAFFGQFGRYEGLTTYISYLLVYWFAANVHWSNERLIRFFTALSVGAGVVSLYGVLQAVGVDPLAWPAVQFEKGRVFSAFGNPIMLASYLSLVLPVCLALAVENQVPAVYRRLGQITVTVVSTAMVLTFARAGWLAALAGVGAYFLITGQKKRFAIMIVVMVLAGAAFIISAPRFQNRNAVSEALLERRGSVNERVEAWRVGARALRKRPVLGYGPDNFQLAFAPLDRFERSVLVAGGKLIDNAHNYPLQLAVTLGLPAAIVFFTWLFVLMRRAVRVSRIRNSRLLPALIAGIIGYIAAMMFTVSSLGAGVVFWAFAGVTRRVLDDRESSERGLSKPAPILWAGAGALLGTLFVLAALTMVAADLRFQAAKQANYAGRNQEALHLHADAVALSPLNSKYLTDFGLLYLNKALVTRNRADYDRTLEIFDRVEVLNPFDSDAHMLVGQTYLFYGREVADRALIGVGREHLLRSVKLWPYGASNNFLLGETYLALGKKKEAGQRLERALALNPEFTAAKEALKAAKQ